MDRDEAVTHIESLYPIDCEYEDTNEIGAKLLIAAIRELDWRNLPDAVLIRYAQLCIDKESSS